MAFNNRGRNSGSSRSGGFRPRFNDRGSSRGPVEMHKAICDNCGKECEVPFRPTSGKPIFCSNCFENKRGGSENRPMFDSVCADCGNKCSVPFQPSGDKPVFCSDCFGKKKNVGGRDKFEELNAKLDKILNLLSPIEKPLKVVKKETKSKETTPITEE